ncbi:MAG: hypothetical protein ABIJ56_20165 [Pseudomonadota bacterium]
MASAARRAPDDAALAKQSLIFINGFEPNTAFLLQVIREQDGGVVPKRRVQQDEILVKTTTSKRARVI